MLKLARLFLSGSRRQDFRVSPLLLQKACQPKLSAIFWESWSPGIKTVPSLTGTESLWAKTKTCHPLQVTLFFFPSPFPSKQGNHNSGMCCILCQQQYDSSVCKEKGKVGVAGEGKREGKKETWHISKYQKDACAAQGTVLLSQSSEGHWLLPPSVKCCFAGSLVHWTL